jgi:ATP-dependent Zn protease
MRGVRAGPDRDALLLDLGTNGASISGKIVSSTSGSAVATSPAKESRFWWEPFIWPAVGLVAVAAFWKHIAAPIGVLIGRATKRVGGKDADESKDVGTFSRRPDERFSDIGGSRVAVGKMIALKNKIEAYKNGNTRVTLPRGVLMFGDPGVGKTFTGRCVAGEADCPFLYKDASSFESSHFAGDWTQEVKSYFARLRKERDKLTKELRSRSGATGKEKGVVIGFIDEFDSMGKKRGQNASHNEHDKALNAFLAEMDGVDKDLNDGIIIMAATNNYDQIDSALLRPGRFYERIQVLAPQNTAERLDVLSKVSEKVFEKAKVKLQTPEALAELARICGDLSPDHLRGIILRASDAVTIENRRVVKREDLYEAFQQELCGERSENVLSPARHELVAYHENGHAVMGLACEVDPLIVSMVARGDSGGRVFFDVNRLLEGPVQRQDLLKAMLFCAGGRAGEIAGYGLEGVSSGVSKDYEQLRSLARQFIAAGMIDGYYAPDIEKVGEHELPDEIREALDLLCDNAILIAESTLKKLKENTLKKIVESSLVDGKEFIGPEATEFYKKRITSDEFKAVKDCVEAFLKDPFLGNTPQSLHSRAGRVHGPTKAT